MNDLQLALLGVGGAVIVLMLGWNWFQDHRVKRENNQRFEKPLEDPLLSGHARAEPTIHVGGSELHGASLSAQFDQNMLVGQTRPHDGQLNGVVSTPSELLHTFVYLTFDTPQPIDLINERLQNLKRTGNKAVRISCMGNDEHDDRWYLPTPGSHVTNIRFAIQLANRKGPLTAIEYSEFLSKLMHFTELYPGEIDSPDMPDTIGRADKLDQQAANLDTLMGLHCVLPDSVSPQLLQDELSKAGWVSVGRHWWLADGDQPLASVVIHDTPGKRVLSFTLDVPNAADPVKAIDAIGKLGTQVASTYHGALMDDAGRPVAGQAMASIRQQLIQRAQELTNAGFAPGSAVARQLFA